MRRAFRVFFSVLLPLTCAAPAIAAGPFPGIDVKDLDPDEVGDLVEFMKEGACPCDPKKTILACIQESSCDKATDLARYGIDKLRDGMGIDQVREAVVRRYMEENVRFSFDLSGTPRKGAEKPVVTIIEFADFECPHCAAMRGILEEVVKAFPGQVAVYFKQFPLSQHTWSHHAARAALAAGRQDRFWQMHDLLFINQFSLSEERFVEFATELGLNIERFKTDMEDSALYSQIERDKQEAMRSNLTGTPTLYINGRLYLDDKDAGPIKAYVQRMIDAETKAAPAKEPVKAPAPAPKPSR